jgi:hypothetical protein
LEPMMKIQSSGHGGGVSETCAVVNIVRADGGPGELL